MERILIAAAAPATIRLTTLPPLSLYVHVPWCLRKCPYCDFNSHELRPHTGASDAGEVPVAAFVEAVLLDLERDLPLIWGRPVHSIFFGGGTPSLLPAAAVAEIISGVRARVRLLPDAEITLEANPGTFEAERFEGFRAAGVTRLSLGVQSFDDTSLQRIGRVHDGGAARSAAVHALETFARVNLDLMYGLPGQSVDDAVRDIERALALGAEHLSVYHLTLEPNTLFAARPPEHLPDEDVADEMAQALSQRLTQSGLQNYEVSAWARPGAECQHNLNYWQFGDYLGIGPGAHAKISFPDRILRQSRVRQPRDWLNALQTPPSAAPSARLLDSERHLLPKELPFEFMLNALRLRAGVPTSLFAERAGVSSAMLARGIEEALARGLIDPDPRVLRATPLGARFLNDLVSVFLPD